MELVVVSLLGVVAAQLAVVAVFKGGGEQVETLDEVGDGSVAEFVGQRKTQRTTCAVGWCESTGKVTPGRRSKGPLFPSWSVGL